MALPLLWLGGAALGAILLADEREKRYQLALNRRRGVAPNTNQYKDLIAQREFSGPEARSLIAPALMTFTTSMWFATSEEHSYSTVKLVNTASEPLKLACKECFGLPTSALNQLIREQPLCHPFALN